MLTLEGKKTIAVLSQKAIADLMYEQVTEREPEWNVTKETCMEIAKDYISRKEKGWPFAKLVTKNSIKDKD